MMSVRALALLIALGVVPALAAAGDAETPVAMAVSQEGLPPSNAADRVATALEDPVLRELVRDTLERNPGLATAIAVARASLHAAPQAQALPDPVVGVTGYLSSPETRVGPQRLVATLSQRLPWSGKRSLRQQAALHQSETLVSDVSARRLDLVTEVRRLSLEIAYLDAYRKVVETDRETLIHYEQLARARYASGVGIEQGVIKIQAEITKDDNRLLDIAARRAAFVADLNALRDRPQGSPVPEIALPRGTRTAPPLDAVRARARAARPELDGATAEIARADTLVELARKDYKPDITVGATYGFVTGRTDLGAGTMTPLDNGRDIFGLSVSLNLPFKRGRLDAGLEEATERRLAAVEHRRDVGATVDRAVGELVERLRLSGEQVELFERVLLIQAEQSLRSAESGYAAGNLNSLDLLDAERVLLDVRTGIERARADHAVTLARLEGAIGAPLVEAEGASE
ncbi:MAG: TolC family protein [Acidobacteria bacterium]|jgi:outer membrane protein TolC|nr:TolC family protein [Acidobacteriota bacterium]